MKKLIIISFVALFAACTSYKTFIQVTPQTGVPKGSSEVVCTAGIDQFKEVLKANNIMYKAADDGGGIETEEFMIDEGTRAKFKVYVFDDKLKIVPYWGITQKVKSEMTVWVGYAAASAYDVNALDRAIYDNNTSRPGKVFCYACQLAKKMNVQLTYK